MIESVRATFSYIKPIQQRKNEPTMLSLKTLREPYMLVNASETHRKDENAKFSHSEKRFDQIIPVPYKAEFKERVKVGQMLLIKGSLPKESMR